MKSVRQHAWGSQELDTRQMHNSCKNEKKKKKRSRRKEIKICVSIVALLLEYVQISNFGSRFLL
jgi:hypothetical protein